MPDETQDLSAAPRLAAGQYWRDIQGGVHGPLMPRDGGGFEADSGAWHEDGTPMKRGGLALTCFEPLGEAAKG